MHISLTFLSYDLHLKSLQEYYLYSLTKPDTLFLLSHPLISINLTQTKMGSIQNHLTQQMTRHLQDIQYFQSIYYSLK